MIQIQQINILQRPGRRQRVLPQQCETIQLLVFFKTLQCVRFVKFFDGLCESARVAPINAVCGASHLIPELRIHLEFIFNRI